MERLLERIARKLVYKVDNTDSIFLEWFYLFLLSVLNNIVYAFYADQRALGRWVWLEAFAFLLLSAVGVLLKIYLLIIPAFAVAVFLFTPYLRNILYLGTALAGYLSVLAAVMTYRMGASSGFTAITTLFAFITGYGLVNTCEVLVSFFRKVKRVLSRIRKVLVLALVAVIVLSSSNAFAFDPKHVVFYTYGGFDAIYNAFHFISLIFSDKSYKGLFFTVMALSLFFAGFRNYVQSLQGRHTGNILSWSMPVLIAFILYIALIVPKGQVTIYDTVLNKSADVGGIPVGITTVAGIASEVENGIISIIDTTDINREVDYENSAGGVGVMAIMNMAMHGVRSSDVYLDRSLKRYIEDCVFYDLNDPGAPPNAKITYQELINGTEPFTQILSKASAFHSIYTVYYDASHNAGETMTCYQAWQNILPVLDNNNNFQSALKNMCAGVGVDTTDTIALQHCKDVLTAYLQVLYNGQYPSVTGDAMDFIRQAYVANEIYRASVDADSSFLVNYRIANTGMNVGMAFNTWIPTIRAVLIALGLSILPFLIIFLPTPLYGKIIGAIVGVFVFMVSWAMLDATVHRFLVGEAQTLFQSAVIHHVGYGAFLTMSTPLQHTMAMWGYVRSLAMGMAAIGAGIFTRVGAYGLQMAIGRMEGAVTSQASTIGEQATNPAEQGNLEKSIAVSSAFSQKIAPAVSLQDIIRGEAGSMKRQIGQGIGLGPKALETGETEGEMAAGTASQIRNMSRDTGQSVENIAAISTQMTTGKLIDEALDVDKNNPMAGAEKIASTNAKVAAGGVRAWNKAQKITGKPIEEASEDTQIGKVVHSMADYNALKNTGFRKSMDYLAINELNQFRQNRGFVQLFEKAGLLSKDFYNKSPDKQIEELKGAFDHLGSHPENIPIGADLARRLGLRGAGTYTIGMTPDGRYVQIVGKSGANLYDVKHGFEEVSAAPIINGQRVGKPVLLKRTSGTDIERLSKNLNVVDVGTRKNIGDFETVGARHTYYDNLNERVGGSVTTKYADRYNIFSGMSVDTGNGYDGFVNSLTSAEEWQKMLEDKKFGLIGFIRSKNEEVYLTGLNRINDVISGVVSRNKVMSLNKNNDQSVSRDKIATDSVSVSLGFSSSGSGASFDHENMVRATQSQASRLAHANQATSRYNELLDNLRESEIKIFKETENIADANMREKVRTSMLADLFSQTVQNANFYAEKDYKTPIPTPSDEPVLKPADSSASTSTPEVEDKFKDALELWELQDKVRAEKERFEEQNRE